MGQIQSSIKLNDGMTPVLRQITKAMGAMLNAFESVQKASSKTIDVQTIQYARDQIGRANASLQQMANGFTKAGNASKQVENANRRIKPAIDQNSKAQQKFNGYIRSGISESHRFLSSIKSLVGAYMGMQGLGSVIRTADTLATTKARLNLINDGSRTTDELQQRIYESAMNVRAGYAETADIVAKLATRAGKVFSNNDEAIAFSNTLQKMFHIAGASTQEMNSASLQLVQALGSGVLRGEELNAVFEAAPNVIEAIAKYMNKPIGKIRELAKKGEISAGIVKAAMFNAADEVNEKFKKLPMTWGQVWTVFKNFAIKSFEPLLERISAITSSDVFKSIAGGIAKSVQFVAKAITLLFDKVAAIAKYIHSNWNKLKPIILGVVSAIIALRTAIFATKVAYAAYNMVMGVMIARQKLAAMATFSQVVQQTSLNAAMLACPWTWLVLGIVALISVIGTVIACTYDWENSNIDLKKTIFNVMNAIKNIAAKTVEFLKKTWLNAWGKIKEIALEVWDVLKGIGNVIADNWSFVAPIIWGIVGAFAAYKTALIAIATWKAISAGAILLWTGIVAVAKFIMSLFTIATWAQVWANIKLTVTGWAASSPLLFWIVVIVAIIVIFYLLIAAINKLCGTSISATGLICAAFTGLAMHVFNMFSFMWNIVASWIEFFVNVWSNPMYSVKKLFVNLATNAIDCFIAMTEGCDEFATNFVNAMYDAINWVLEGWNWLVDKLGSVGEKMGLGKATMLKHTTSITSDLKGAKASLEALVADKPADYWEAPKLGKLGTQDVRNAYDFGAGLGDKLSSGTQDLFGSGKDKLSSLFDKLSGSNLKDLIATKDTSKSGGSGVDDLTKALNGDFNNPALDNIAKDTGAIADNTGDAEEDFSYLRELAEREAINRYTLTDLKIDMTNNNSINNGIDADNMMKRLAKELSRAVLTTAEGVTPW